MRKTNTARIGPFILVLVTIISLTACGSSSSGGAANHETMSVTNYGTVDWSTAAHGYVTFTASESNRVLVLQSSDGTKAFFSASKGETIVAPLPSGGGAYQYAIGHSVPNDAGIYIDYKNSFNAVG